jgi:hypothetical protein
MSGVAARLLRIVRVREVEHRIAQLRLAEADRRLASLTQIGERIDMLRARASAGSGVTDGASLNAAGEMAARLEAARADIKAPVAAAEAERFAREKRRGVAWASQEGAARLHERTVRFEAAAVDIRTDANRVHRAVTSRFNDVEGAP